MKNASIIPCLRYKDAGTAIDWLCDVFGFQKHVVYEDDNGIIIHAQLTFRNGMIMIGSTKRESVYGSYIKQPKDIGGLETQSPYLVVEDADAHYNRAISKGAKIAIDIKTEEYGGRGYSCLDPEGHLWNFGSYDPWQVP